MHRLPLANSPITLPIFIDSMEARSCSNFESTFSASESRGRILEAHEAIGAAR
ncbi:MAG: hypothetical protein WDO68_06065 [Gammaproteobacteria bacterium]